MHTLHTCDFMQAHTTHLNHHPLIPILDKHSAPYAIFSPFNCTTKQPAKLPIDPKQLSSSHSSSSSSPSPSHITPMPSFATNIINASYNGQSTSLHYWPDGHGRRVDGYITSLAHLKAKLRSKFRLSQLALYSVLGRQLRPIVTDNHLLAALSHIRKAGTLLINVYKHQPIHHPTQLKSHLKPHPRKPSTRNTPSVRQPSTTRPHSTPSSSKKHSTVPASNSRTNHKTTRLTSPTNINLLFTIPASR